MERLNFVETFKELQGIMRVLVVEDDLPLRRIISTILEDEKYEVDQAENGEDGYILASSFEYDLITLDIMLPIMDGFSLISKIRSEGFQTPTLFLTAKDRIEDRVKGLDLGADDYIVKPFATDLGESQVTPSQDWEVGNRGEIDIWSHSLRYKSA